MEIKTSEQLAELAKKEILLEQTIYQSLLASFREKLRELPPPPAGYYYYPELKSTEFKNGEYIITSDIVLKPIVTEDE